MSKPLVALVGRPNVGKSTFFNKISGERKAIVQDMPGVTRDRIYADAEWCGYNFTMIDTGGIELKSTDEMWRHIKEQAEIAIDTADVIIFFTDCKGGLTQSDREVAEKLRKSNKPIILAVNKMDNYDPILLADFYELGIGEPYGISCEQGKGLGDVLDAVCEHFDRIEYEKEEGVLNIAVVGKPNAGKSSLVNKMLGYDRTIVSNIAGTTRDSIDTPFTVNGEKYILIDTAGIRKKKNVHEDVEYYSVVRALASIRKADVVLIVVDAEEGLTEQDVKICGYVHEQGKPSVVVMNKWDLIEKDTNTINDFEKKLQTDLAFMDYYKSAYISAKTGQRVEKVLSIARKVYENASRRISTGVLNDVLGDAIRTTEPPSKKGRRLKIYYTTQDGVCPPTFIVFVNNSEIMHFSYKRFLENTIRKINDFSGTPIRLFVREKGGRMKLNLTQFFLAFFIVAITSYLIGCINFAIIISKAKNKGKGDIRSIGSGNPGMLNMSRAYGIKIGVLILLLDILKGLVPCLVCRFVFKKFTYNDMPLEQTALFTAGLSAVCGHIFPFWLKFKGGKGISTTIGVFLAAQPLFTLAFGISAIVFILITSMGSMGSFIATTPSAIVSCWFFYKDYVEYFNKSLSLKLIFLFTSFTILATILITWWAHRKNIQRLLVGEEHPTNWLQMIKNLKFKSKIKKQK